MSSKDITFCTYFDCKFYNSCKRYVYIYNDEELARASVMDFKPSNSESDIPEKYCEFYKRGGY